MSKRDYPEEYYYSKIQQGKIKELILKALPDDGTIYYHNLIVALAELLADFTRQGYKGEMYGEVESPVTYQQKPVEEWKTGKGES